MPVKNEKVIDENIKDVKLVKSSRPEWDDFKQSSVDKSKLIIPKFSPKKMARYEGFTLKSLPEKVTYTRKNEKGEDVEESFYVVKILDNHGTLLTYNTNESFRYCMRIAQEIYNADIDYQFIIDATFDLQKQKDGTDKVIFHPLKENLEKFAKKNN